jgi:hypothetical protein
MSVEDTAEGRLSSRTMTALRSAALQDTTSQPTTGRHEFKYLVRSEMCNDIAAFVAPSLELDKYSQSRPRDSYTVRSIYYDSPSFRCYYEKANGEKNRRKYRVRTYNDGAATFLECKQRKGSTYTKPKVRLGAEELAALHEQRGIDSSVDNPSSVLGQLLISMDRWEYQPTALVVYDRIAYVYPGQQDMVRVTFDRNLRGRVFPSLHEIYDEEELTQLLYGWTILEVKFNDIVPRFFHQLVTKFALQRQACSKYGICVALLIDEYPTKKEGWNHVYVR